MFNKLAIFLVLFFGLSVFAESKELTLKECQQLAVENNPMGAGIKNYKQITGLESERIGTQYLPQIKLNAQATYQSDVFGIPLSFPGVAIPEVPKDQYMATLNVNQTIYEGGMVSNGMNVQEKKFLVDSLNVETGNQSLKESINTLFFGALAIEKNISALKITEATLQSKIGEIENLVKNGVALSTGLDALKIELIKTRQNIDALESDKKALVSSLALKIKDNNPDDITLVAPDLLIWGGIQKVNRPEHALFYDQKDMLESQRKMLNAQLRPQVGAFVKFGYGNPNPMNMFSDGWKEFYQAGVSLNWNLWDWGSVDKSKEQIEVNKELINIQQKNFNLNLETQLVKLRTDITKYQGMIEKDNQIADTQKRIADVIYSQMKNGDVTSTEYISELNKLTQSQINLELHKLYLIQTEYDYLTKTGNY